MTDYSVAGEGVTKGADGENFGESRFGLAVIKALGW